MKSKNLKAMQKHFFGSYLLQYFFRGIDERGQNNRIGFFSIGVLVTVLPLISFGQTIDLEACFKQSFHKAPSSPLFLRQHP